MVTEKLLFYNLKLKKKTSGLNFHIFTCILHLLQVYYELTKWPAPSGLIAQLVEHCTGSSNPVQA